VCEKREHTFDIIKSRNIERESVYKLEESCQTLNKKSKILAQGGGEITGSQPTGEGESQDQQRLVTSNLLLCKEGRDGH
jgi:hypothetical protein